MEDAPYRNTRSSSSGSKTTNWKETELMSLDPQTPQTVSRIPSSISPKNSAKRQRTSSGHLITNSVGDIRNFFTHVAEGNSPITANFNSLKASQSADKAQKRPSQPSVAIKSSQKRLQFNNVLSES